MGKKILFIAGLVFLLSVITDIVLWIVIATSGEKSFDETVKEYMNWFPKFLANPIKLTFLNILLLLIAIGCFIISKNKSKNSGFKKICFILIILSGVLAFWNLFTLM